MHGWQWVREARMNPQRCAVFPHIQAGGYIDTGIEINSRTPPRVYISQTAAQELGKFVGMVPGDDKTAVEQELAAANAEIHDLRRQVDELTEFKSAVHLVSKEMNV